MVKGGAGKVPSGVGRLSGESGTEVVENGVEPPYSKKEALFGAISAGDVEVAVLAVKQYPKLPRVAAHFAVLNKATADIGFEKDLNLFAAVWANYEKLVFIHGGPFVA